VEEFPGGVSEPEKRAVVVGDKTASIGGDAEGRERSRGVHAGRRAVRRVLISARRARAREEV
jgi:hypothetical protein